jgi:hypothetical protein
MSYDLNDYRSDAEDEACRDARAIVNFLDAAIGPEEKLEFMPHMPACFVQYDRHEVGVLLALAFDAGQPSDTRAAAMDELRARFLAELGDDAITVIAQKWMEDAHPELTAYAEMRE